MTINSMGSGIDTKAMVDAIMEGERFLFRRMEKERAISDNQLANTNKMGTLLHHFSHSLDDLQQIIEHNSYKATSSNDSSVNVILTSGQVSTSQYNLNITQLATAHQLASTPFSDKQSPLNSSSTLNVQSGNSQFTLTLSPDDTLESVRDKINQSSSNTSASAAILATTAIDGTTEYRLVLTSKETGVANALQLSGDGLSVLGLTNELTAAKDAQFSFDGFNVTRSTNTINDLIDGMTFTLNAANVSATISITEDSLNKNELTKKAIHQLVDEYNTLMEVIDKNQNTKYVRDGVYSRIKLSLENTMNGMLGPNAPYNLFALGIKTAAATEAFNYQGDKAIKYMETGKLTIDDDILSQALNNNYQNAASTFSDPTSGFIALFQAPLYDLTKEGGTLPGREKSIQKQERQIDMTLDKEESRLESLEKRLIRQFSAVDTFVSRYQKISNFLEQQLLMLNKKINL